MSKNKLSTLRRAVSLMPNTKTTTPKKKAGDLLSSPPAGRSPLAARLPLDWEPFLNGLSQGKTLVEVGRDRIVYRQGDSADSVYYLKEGKVKLEEVKKEELPPEMQKMTIDEQRAFLKKCDERRAELKTQAIELDRKRSAFIAAKQAENQKNRQLDSFDQNVFDILRRQAARANIEYKK